MSMQALIAVTSAALALAVAAPAAAQDTTTLELPEYTTEQRWERAARLFTVQMVVGIIHARGGGTSPEEFGGWMADLFSPGWGEPGSGSPDAFVRSHNRNLQVWPGAIIEILSHTEESVTARINRPWACRFGEDGTAYGVTIEEFERAQAAFVTGITDYLGLRYEERRDGDWIVFTVTEGSAS